MAPARLDGRTVVVTRGKGGEDALTVRLAELGAAVRDLPAVEIGPPQSADALDAALRELPRLDWAVFASANAVARTVERMDALELPRAWLALRSLAAVGPATAERLAREVRAPDLVPEEATGAATAAALAGRVRGLRVLVPRPAEGRPELVEGLAAAGAEVLAPVAYRTVPAPAERIRALAGWIEAGEVDAVTFASPSAVKAVVAGLGPRAELLRRVLLASIGPTTSAALREAGFPPGVEPGRHTGRDLAEAVAGRLGAG
ncbi:MAG TPA: uroporphyrinogen-III synthase [Anaeromyxobacteraceae bacterium]|nr:uroporphyrinogen-III synthase [Anaeromyxobacteraceae bacterium]